VNGLPATAKRLRASVTTTKDFSDNVSEFFDNMAALHNLDPLLPDTWYSILSRKNILSQTRGQSVFRQYTTPFHAIMDAYPSIYFEPAKFKNAFKGPKVHWDAKARKNFFEEFARNNGFDPLLASSWYRISTTAILKENRGTYILKCYKGSLVAALLDLFPEVEFDMNLFHNQPRNSRQFKLKNL